MELQNNEEGMVKGEVIVVKDETAKANQYIEKVCSNR